MIQAPVAGQETHEPRRESGLTAAEQGHIARAAEGERPLRRAVAARYLHRHQQRLGQPALPIVPCCPEKGVSSRESHETTVARRATAHLPDRAASLRVSTLGMLVLI